MELRRHASEARHYDVDIDRLSDDERDQPHLRAIFDLLIRTNPAFVQFKIQDGWWGWARKSPSGYWLRRGGLLCGANPAPSPADKAAEAAPPKAGATPAKKTPPQAPGSSGLRDAGRRVWRRLPPGVAQRIRNRARRT